MGSKLRLLSQVIVSFIAASIIISAVFFGVSILTNIHLAYIRYQSKDVVTLLNERNGGGTGFVIKAKSGKTYILTNRHICKSTELGVLQTIYRGDKYLVNIIEMYDLNDLCLVEAPSTALDSLSLAYDMQLGERAYAVGHPLLEPITVTEGELSTNVTITMISGQNVAPETCKGPGLHLLDLSDNPFALIFGVFNQCLQDFECNSSTISIQPGNSGSPILNIYGHVIGVAFAANEAGSHSYIVPLKAVKEFLDGF